MYNLHFTRAALKEIFFVKKTFRSHDRKNKKLKYISKHRIRKSFPLERANFREASQKGASYNSKWGFVIIDLEIKSCEHSVEADYVAIPEISGDVILRNFTSKMTLYTKGKDVRIVLRKELLITVFLNCHMCWIANVSSFFNALHGTILILRYFENVLN